MVGRYNQTGMQSLLKTLPCTGAIFDRPNWILTAVQMTSFKWRISAMLAESYVHTHKDDIIAE